MMHRADTIRYWMPKFCPTIVCGTMIVLLVACTHASNVHMPSHNDGPQLAYVDEGRGAPIIFVHGASSDYRAFEPIRPYISKQFRYISISRRYHHPNSLPGPGAIYSFESNSADLAEFIRVLNIAPVHLVAHSWGGPVALLMTIEHPELVRSLTLIEGNVGSLLEKGQEEAAEIQSRNQMVADVRRLINEGREDQALELTMDWVDGYSGAFKQLPSPIRRMMRENANTIGLTYNAPPLAIKCDQVSALHVPVLLINGEHTRPYYRLIKDALQECLPAAQSVIIPGAEHSVVSKSPADLAGKILSFVKEK
jgi:pimeloyl-ACP methyl ester carboxylesterase